MTWKNVKHGDYCSMKYPVGERYLIIADKQGEGLRYQKRLLTDGAYVGIPTKFNINIKDLRIMTEEEKSYMDAAIKQLGTSPDASFLSFEDYKKLNIKSEFIYF